MTCDLVEGLLSLDLLSGYQELSPPVWCVARSAWWWRCRFRVDVEEHPWIREETDWVVIVSGRYPWGSVAVFPASEGGITATFQHQLHNAEGDGELPCREGKLCLHRGDFVLPRAGFTQEPRGQARDRIRWHLERAMDWVQRASRNDLVRDSEPFELPLYPLGSLIEVVFDERVSSLEAWSQCRSYAGYVRLQRCATSAQHHRLVLTEAFYDYEETELMRSQWGGWVRRQEMEEFLGVWLRFDEVIVESPWEAPVTWSALKNILGSRGRSLREALRKLLPKLRQLDRKVKWLLLLGFPIPEKLGDQSAARMHWLAIEPPRLRAKSRELPGFRPGRKVGLWEMDRKEFTGELKWAGTQAWTAKDLGSRGRLPTELTKCRVLLIGAGSLGSLVGEMLVRGGVHRLSVMDGDFIQAGNLVRHVLTLDDLGKNKAEALARKLEGIAPQVEVEALARPFEGHASGALKVLEDVDLILDTTGEEELLVGLGPYLSSIKANFCTVSIGYGGRRLYFYACPSRDFDHEFFWRRIAVWVQEDLQDVEGEPSPMEGVGCWNPVFPARYDDLALQASFAVKELERQIGGGFLGDLVVFEQLMVDGFCSGVRRIYGNSAEEKP